MRIGSLVCLALCAATAAQAQQTQQPATGYYYPPVQPPMADPFGPPGFAPPPALPLPPPMMPYPGAPALQPMPAAPSAAPAVQAPARAQTAPQAPAQMVAPVSAPMPPQMPVTQPAPQMTPAAIPEVSKPVQKPKKAASSPGRPIVIGASEAAQLGKGLSVQDSRIGAVLADGGGLTLYAPSAAEAEGCKDCGLWQPVLAEKAEAVPAPLEAAEREGGALQWSYAGHLLYRWGGDEAAGDITGDGVDGNWFAVRVSRR